MKLHGAGFVSGCKSLCLKHTSMGLVLLVLAHVAFLSNAGGPRVIIVGAGMSGISAGKRLSEAGITDLVILEATDRMGGRIHNAKFAGVNVEMGANWVEGVNVEMGANWVEGVNGDEMNPIWTMANGTGGLNLRTFRSDFSHLAGNTYKQDGGLYDEKLVEKIIERVDEVAESGRKLSSALHHNGQLDMSVMAMQRLNYHMPSGPVGPLDMVIDYYHHDFEFAEPPRVTSLLNTQPLATFNNFGNDVYFVADHRGYESVVYHIAEQYLETDHKSGAIITYLPNSVMVNTEDNKEVYQADYVIVSASLGVLQTDLIRFNPELPWWKMMSIYQFNMAVYTKIFLKFPRRFWPEGPGKQFFLYASDRRGYYTVWQQFQKEYLGRTRIEQQSDKQTLTEAMEVLRKMFPGKDVPDATEILVPRWWSNRFFRGTFSNWPIGVNRYEYDLIRAPVGRVYFTGEHTSEKYNGYVHGAYLAGIDSANILINCAEKKMCTYNVKGKLD
ncbi:hypothetical protein ZWY2020_023576 [Hordeum vulgare]|nr:hypothetical protein ZWY2020_023576 [Hordeum vulgare]